MTDTSSLHGIGFQGGHPCRGTRCRSHGSASANLFGLRCRKVRTGGSSAVGSAFILTPATSGLSAGRPAKSSPIVRAFHMPARSAPSASDRAAHCGGARRTPSLGSAQYRALPAARGRCPVPRIRRCTRSCAAMAALLRLLCGAARTSVLRSLRPICSGRWTSKATWRSRSGGRCHPLTVLDDHSRYALCLKACATSKLSTVQSHLQSAFRRYGLPEAFFVDSGTPWSYSSGKRWTRFAVWLLKLGIAVVHSRPYNKPGLTRRCCRSAGPTVPA